MCEAFAGLLKEADARVCKCYSRQMPLEQCDAQLLFEGAHPPANRGVPHAERTCSRPEAQMFCDGESLLDRDRVDGGWVGRPGRWFAARHVCVFPQHAANPWAAASSILWVFYFVKPEDAEAFRDRFARNSLSPGRLIGTLGAKRQ